MARNSKTNLPASQSGAQVVVLPAPRAVNLHNLEAVRREMARVYRDMRSGAVASQDGARLVYVLGEIRKMFEVCDLEKRIQALEVMNGDD